MRWPTLPSLFADNEFRKATRSGTGKPGGGGPNCVEIARRDEHVEIRDSKRKGATTYAATGLRLTSEEFDHFQNVVRTANLRTARIPHKAFDGCAVMITRLGENTNVLHRSDTTINGLTDVGLTYTDSEIFAFLDGVHAHEFDADSATSRDTAAISPMLQPA